MWVAVGLIFAACRFDPGGVAPNDSHPAAAVDAKAVATADAVAAPTDGPAIPSLGDAETPADAASATPDGRVLPPADAQPPDAAVCVDRDKDGFSAPVGGGDCGPNTDCDDSDPDVHPGQKSFFATPTASGDFDYDCDGIDTREHPDTFTGCSFFCGGGGWKDAVPDCGDDGTFVSCSLGIPCQQNLETRTQRCR